MLGVGFIHLEEEHDMIVDFAHARPPARRRRWIRAVAVLPVLAVSLVGAAVSSSALASTAAPSDRYTVCLPTPCMPIADATVTGTMAWDANANIFRAQNNLLPLVTVWFTEIDNGRETNLPPIRVVRGKAEPGTLRIKPTTDALRISLCNGASDAPTSECANTTVTR